MMPAEEMAKRNAKLRSDLRANFGKWARAQLSQFDRSKQAAFADMIGVKQPTVSRWVQGEAPSIPRTLTLVRISMLTGATFDEMLGLSGTAPPRDAIADMLELVKEGRRYELYQALKREFEGRDAEFAKAAETVRPDVVARPPKPHRPSSSRIKPRGASTDTGAVHDTNRTPKKR